MTLPRPNRAGKAGGFLLAASILVGTLAGLFLGQPSIGFLAGAGIGIALTALVWVADRRR
jgi:hypothetical protein